MSGQNSRTVTLTLDTQTNGTENVVKLAGELEKLAKKGGEAAPEFQRLADELSAIAKQQDAVSAFNQTAEAVSKAEQAMQTARLAAQAEKEALATLEAQLKSAKQAESAHAVEVEKAASSLRGARTAYLESRAAISAYLAEIGGAKSASREEAAQLKEKQQALRETKAAYDGAKVAVAELSPEYLKLKQATTEAAAGFREQQTAFDWAAHSAKKASDEYSTLSETFGKVGKALNTLGMDAQNVVTEQNRITQSMAKLEAEGRKLAATLPAVGTAALTSAQRIEQAFGTVGVKSVNAIHGEITKVRNAMMALAADTGVTEADFQRAFSSGKAKIADLEKQLRQAEGAANSLGSSFGSAFSQFAPASFVFNAVTAGINAITSAATKIPQVTAEFQTMMRTLTVLTGSTTAAAKEFEYIKNVANRTGADIKGLGDSYIRLAAATKDTALEGAQTKRIFEAVSGAMGMLGASSAEAENALMAVSQMVSKGVVSMEEMRQQLGERLPGAFQVTAKELGITVADLNALISSGKLAADDVLPAMARGLEKMYNTGAKNDTLIGKWREFTNALKITGDAMGESGLLDSLLKVGRVGTAVVTVLIEGFLSVGKSIGILAAGIAQGDLKGALAAIADEFKKVDERAGAVAGRASATQKSVADLAAEARKAGQDFIVMSDGTKMAVASVEGANDGFIKFLNTSAKSAKSAEDFATSARKAAEYTRAAGEASITAVNALGSEIEKRQTAQKVAEDNARALDALVVAERKVLEVMDAEAMKRAEAIRDGAAASDAHKKQLTELGDEIQKRRTALEGMQNQADANRVLAQSMEIQAETSKDNSSRLAELKTRYDELSASVAATNEAVKAGTMTQAQANVVKQEAMKVERLYVDALNDSKANIAASLSVKRAQLDLDTAGINLAIQQQQTIYQTAKFMGDEYAANQALLKIKEYQIKLMELTAKMRAAEAEAQLAQIEMDRAESVSKGTLTAAVEAELKARTLAAQAKVLEGKIASETAKQMKDLYDRTVSGGEAASGAAGGYDTLAKSMNRAADAASNLSNAQGKGGGPAGTLQGDTIGGEKGFLDGGHQADGKLDITSLMYRKGATIEEAAAAQKYFGELQSRLGSTLLNTNLGNETNAARQQRNVLNMAMEQALKYAKVELATGQKVDLGQSAGNYAAQNLAKLTYNAGSDGIGMQRQAIQEAGQKASAQKATVTINLNGKSQKVNVDSVADANGLAAILKQLESDSARTY